jgi:hypothetical protein
MGGAGAGFGAWLSGAAGGGDERRRLGVLAGMAAAFGPLLPGAYLGVLLLLELLQFAVRPAGALFQAAALMTAASSASYCVYMLLADQTFLDVTALPQAAYDEYDWHLW